MKKNICIYLLFALLFIPLADLYAQSTTNKDTITFDRSTIPQWAKDIRRFDIISFGTFPFTVMVTNMAYEPLLKDSIKFTGTDHTDILLISAGLSLTLATIDIIITLVKRNNEKRRLENIPIGSYDIEILPYGEDSGQINVNKEDFVLKIDQIIDKLYELQDAE